jgi:hypothetical protein
MPPRPQFAALAVAARPAALMSTRVFSEVMGIIS